MCYDDFIDNRSPQEIEEMRKSMAKHLERNSRRIAAWPAGKRLLSKPIDYGQASFRITKGSKIVINKEVNQVIDLSINYDDVGTGAYISLVLENEKSKECQKWHWQELSGGIITGDFILLD